MATEIVTDIQPKWLVAINKNAASPDPGAAVQYVTHSSHDRYEDAVQSAGEVDGTVFCADGGGCDKIIYWESLRRGVFAGSWGEWMAQRDPERRAMQSATRR